MDNSSVPKVNKKNNFRKEKFHGKKTMISFDTFHTYLRSTTRQ